MWQKQSKRGPGNRFKGHLFLRGFTQINTWFHIWRGEKPTWPRRAGFSTSLLSPDLFHHKLELSDCRFGSAELFTSSFDKCSFGKLPQVDCGS